MPKRTTTNYVIYLTASVCIDLCIFPKVQGTSKLVPTVTGKVEEIAIEVNSSFRHKTLYRIFRILRLDKSSNIRIPYNMFICNRGQLISHIFNPANLQSLEA